MNNKEKRYDFRTIGQDIKETRTNNGITREHLAEQVVIAVRNHRLTM